MKTAFNIVVFCITLTVVVILSIVRLPRAAHWVTVKTRPMFWE